MYCEMIAIQPFRILRLGRSIACALLVAVLTSGCGRGSMEDTVLGGDLHTTTSTEDSLAKAKRMCSSFTPPGNPDAELFGFQMTTLADVNRSLSIFNAEPINPNAFEDGAVTTTSPIARCSYLGEVSAASPTTICEDGSEYALEQPLQFLVSEAGAGVAEGTEYLDAILDVC